MKNEQFWRFCLDWLAANTPQLVLLLIALIPVLALCVVGYALRVIHASTTKGGAK